MLKKIASSLTSLSTLFVMMMLIVTFYVPAHAQSSNACREALSRENRRHTAELIRLQEEAYQQMLKFQEESGKCRGDQECQRSVRDRHHAALEQITEQLKTSGIQHKRNVDEIVRYYGSACPRALTQGR